MHAHTFSLLFCCFSVGAWIASAPCAKAQSSTQLMLQSIQVAPSSGPVNFTFVDLGTGATNYVVEFSDALGASGTWQTNANAIVTPQGGGTYAVQINEPRMPKRFYRVNGLGGSLGPIIIEFSTTAFTVVEGDDVFPTLLLNQPFNGLVHYSVSGTAKSGDYMELTGQVMVNGTMATIPVSLTDNEMIGQMKYLTLRLEAGAGYQLGAGTSTTIMIEENDAEWQGSFVTDDATLGFILKIQNVGGANTAILKGDGSGFFPTNGTPASITFTADSFTAEAASIPIPAGATQLNEPMNLTLFLNAMNGVTNQSVSPTLVTGAGTLITRIPTQPHLNTTNAGTFSLLRPPVAPSTNQVGLVAAP
jgi:hypothetical protein